MSLHHLDQVFHKRACHGSHKPLAASQSQCSNKLDALTPCNGALCCAYLSQCQICVWLDQAFNAANVL